MTIVVEKTSGVGPTEVVVNTVALALIRRAFYAALEPPPALTVSQWADRSRMLSPEASAEPGRWRTDRAPYQRAIMDALHEPGVETVVVMSSSQVGKSEILLNVLGYHIDLDPCPILFVQPRLEDAEAFSKDRVDPMLRDTPALRGKVSEPREKDGGNTMRHKRFGGGHLTLAGANSPASLASRPIRLLLADEVDRWKVSLSREGDPLALAEKRTTTFWNRRKLIVSTPTIKGASRIEAKFAESDQRSCHLPCPHCGERFVLEWRHVRWQDDDPGTAHLVCPACQAAIDEAQRAEMLQHPEWRPSAPFRGIAGFHVWEAYSPWVRLADLVAEFLEARKSPETLQVFVNTALGQTWEVRGERPDVHVLVTRREPYEAPVPAGACGLTMGVDVQDDRLELQVVGWGPGEESWVVDVRTLPGDPARAEVWAQLDEVLTTPYQHATGAQLAILATCIDSAGHRTQYVYDYVQKRQQLRVYTTIGRDGPDRPIVSAPAQKRTGRDPRPVPLYTIGVDVCKALVYSRLKLTEKGPGYVHLPMPRQAPSGEWRAGVDEEYVAQLTAETLVTKYRHGVPYKVWVQTRPRNEALDTYVLALAALRLLRPNLEDLARRIAEHVAKQEEAQKPPALPAPPPPDPTPGGRRVTRSPYLAGMGW